MKKGVILTLLAFAGIFLIASFVLAINIDVEKVSDRMKHGFQILISQLSLTLG